MRSITKKAVLTAMKMKAEETLTELKNCKTEIF